jgi:tetratricopeptide (TPR) repeat protein
MESVENFSSNASGVDLDFSEWARECCRFARQQEEAGDYEAARRIMSPFWQEVGTRPRLDGLEEVARAEVLLRTGALSGWLGSANRVEGSQEIAKDLISESLALFNRRGLTDKAAEARLALALCYWREGAFDEARALLQEILERQADAEPLLKAKALLLRAVVENSATRFHDALRFLTEASPLFEQIEDHALKGRFHVTLANNLQCLGTEEDRTDYTDRALVEYAAASFHYEQAGHTRYLATVENNIGFLFFTLDKFEEAHEHLDRARALLVKLRDHLLTAQVDDTRARVFLAQGLNPEAEQVVRHALETFEQAGEHALRAEALTTQGTALARLGRFMEAREALQLAINIAERAGSFEPAGLASLTMLEELGKQLRPDERAKFYAAAVQMLARSQQPEIISRLQEAAHSAGESFEGVQPSGEQPEDARPAVSEREAPQTLIKRFIEEAQERLHKEISFTDEALDAMRHLFFKDQARVLKWLIEQTVMAAEPQAVIEAEAVQAVALRRASNANFAQPWADFSLKNETQLIERQFIEYALKEAQGGISGAAKLLGFNHPEFLNSIIKSRHRELLAARKPPVPRQRLPRKRKKR